MSKGKSPEERFVEESLASYSNSRKIKEQCVVGTTILTNSVINAKGTLIYVDEFDPYVKVRLENNEETFWLASQCSW